ncbi:YebC/PmpR family DNA-binding transcriptional regulator [Populibacterium corticicola]|uniref:Probable transcriptional regulatory protein ACFSYH_02400 n=1 Tax=Populibacterium corticicola TaxID=1812826 RepID=A0ABW5XAT9_9MICO
MSGHSKWATTKHKKAAIDAKRAKSFAKLIKNIEVAARLGGADISGNPALDLAVTKAKKTSVPNDNIDRAIKRGAGLIEGGADYQTIMYEGYAPGGIAVLVECLTDNKNRSAADVRVAFTRSGGQMADPGSVAYMFSRKGQFIVPKGDMTEDDLMMVVLDAGAEEITDEGESFEIICEPSDTVAVREALREAGIENDDESIWYPATRIDVDVDGAKKVFRLIDALEDSDDVQNVYANYNVPQDVATQLEAED